MEKEIDGQTQAPRGGGFEQMQNIMQNREILVGRDHVNVVGFDLHPVPDLDDGHGGSVLQQLGQDALVGWIQVLDDHKGQTASFRHMPKKLLKRLQSASRSAQSYDGEGSLGLARHCSQ